MPAFSINRCAATTSAASPNHRQARVAGKHSARRQTFGDSAIRRVGWRGAAFQFGLAGYRTNERRPA